MGPPSIRMGNVFVYRQKKVRVASDNAGRILRVMSVPAKSEITGWGWSTSFTVCTGSCIMQLLNERLLQKPVSCIYSHAT